MAQVSEILKNSQVQMLALSGGWTDVLIKSSPEDFAALIRHRNKIAESLGVDKAKITLTADDRVISFDVGVKSAKN